MYYFESFPKGLSSVSIVEYRVSGYPGNWPLFQLLDYPGNCVEYRVYTIWTKNRLFQHFAFFHICDWPFWIANIIIKKWISTMMVNARVFLISKSLRNKNITWKIGKTHFFKNQGCQVEKRAKFGHKQFQKRPNPEK